MNNLYKVTLLLLFTVLPFALDAHFATLSLHYPFIWSLLLIPCILLIVAHPRWSVVVLSMFVSEALKIGWVFYFMEHVQTRSEELAWLISSIVNWIILFTVAFYAVKYQKLFQEVRALAFTDALTGLFNRRYFDSYLENTLFGANKEKADFVLVMLDVDHFKKINDTYGHACGDEALIHIVKTIKKNLRAKDMLVRVGGEEFALLLPEAGISEGEMIAKRVRRSVEYSTFSHSGKRIPLTISLGVVSYNGQTKEAFVECADKTMYRAKVSGRNRVAVSQPCA